MQQFKVLAIVSLVTIAGAAHAGVTSLPELGSKRHLVLAEMRRSGLSMKDGRGDRLEFAGGPEGFREAERSIFYFGGFELDHIELYFPAGDDEAATRDAYTRLRQKLQREFGAPWASSTKTNLALANTIWTDFRHKITLYAEWGKARAITVLIEKQNNAPAPKPTVAIAKSKSTPKEPVAPAPEVWETSDDKLYTKQTKLAAEALLDDFGNQRFLSYGAKRKGGPITLRVKDIRVSQGAQGVDRQLLESRVRSFVAGHWDLEMADKSATPDVEVQMFVVPVTQDGQRTYSLGMEARATSGRSRGRVLYSSAKVLEIAEN